IQLGVAALRQPLAQPAELRTDMREFLVVIADIRDEEAAGAQRAVEPRQRRQRIVQMLEYLDRDDDVRRGKLRQRVVARARQHPARQPESRAQPCDEIQAWPPSVWVERPWPRRSWATTRKPRSR